MESGVTEKPDLAEHARRVARKTVVLGYPNWDWGEGVAWSSVAEAGVRLQDGDLLDAATRWLHGHRETQPRELREVMPGLVATTVYRANQDEVALTLARRVGDLLERNPRNLHGVYQESGDIPVWIDYWYEIAPFLTDLAAITGDARYREWAAEQSYAFIHSCWDAKASLYHHAYYDLIRRNSQWFWARANGWAALACVEMLTNLADVPALPAILRNVLRRQVARVQQLQDGSGLWHTVLDQPSTYLEVSASVMLALAIKRGVARGYLDRSLEDVADRAFAACLEHVDRAGNVHQVSAETPPGDIAHYKSIPLGVYPWGQGFMLLAMLEWMGGN